LAYQVALILKISEAPVHPIIETRSNLQTYLSLIILAALVITAAGIFLWQFKYNPAVLNLDHIVSSTAEFPQTQKPFSDQTPFPLPEGLVALSPPETFEPPNLSDKINGKAELYLTAGFVGLQAQRFKRSDATSVWMEAFIYNMASNQNAFAVFSAQRRDDADSLNLTQHSYQTKNALFLVHGPYYLEIIASEASEDIFQPMLQFAEAFVDSIQVKTVQISEKNLFPETDLIQNSISLIASDAFGFERFDQIFTARYAIDGAEIMAFISNRNAADKAIELAEAYQKFLLEFGGRKIEIDLTMKNAMMVEILDTYEVIFSQGTYIAGVREAEDKARAKALAIRLEKKLKEATDEP
jgi:hypothetical protein